MDEQELVKFAKQGDLDAFNRLVITYQGLAYNVAYRLLSNPASAEDITQDVFVKLASKIKGYKGDADFKTWLYRVTVNTSKDLFRKNSRKLANEAAYLEDKKTANQSSTANDNPVSPEERYSALSNLSTKLKEAVILVLGEGLSHKEAAAVLGCAETTVSWRVFKARGKLTKILAQEV